MKKILLITLVSILGQSLYSQTIARYRDGFYDGKYIHGVDNSGEPAQIGDPSYRELPPGTTEGVYTWWNYATSAGQPSGSYGVSIGFGKGQAGSAEIWAGWTNGRLFTRFLRDCCQGWSDWNEIWTAKTDGANSGLDADTVDGLQPLLIQNSGNVGIGTTNPDSKLTVKGKIHAEEVKIDLSVPAPDYVFTKDYDLLTIEEVQQHITEKGHLPNIPSAKEMEANGVELGMMNMKLLEKIEELTLYTIAQEKKILKQESRNQELENKLKQEEIKNQKQEDRIKTLEEQKNRILSIEKQLKTLLNKQ